MEDIEIGITDMKARQAERWVWRNSCLIHFNMLFLDLMQYTHTFGFHNFVLSVVTQIINNKVVSANGKVDIQRIKPVLPHSRRDS